MRPVPVVKKKSPLIQGGDSEIPVSLNSMYPRVKRIELGLRQKHFIKDMNNSIAGGIIRLDI